MPSAVQVTNGRWLWYRGDAWSPLQEGGWLNKAILLDMNCLFSLVWVAQTSEDEYLIKYVSQVCLTGRENDVLCDASANDLNYK